MRLLHLRSVLAVTDLTATSDTAVRSAAELASSAGAALHVAHVAPADAMVVAQSGRRAEFAHELQSSLARIGVTSARATHVLTGDPATAIAELSEHLHADVIVSGRRRSRAAVPMERPLGGTAYAIITQSSVPCLAIQNALVVPLRNVVVAVDGSDASRGALLTGLTWASALRARDGGSVLTAVHIATRDDSSEARASRHVSEDLAAVEAGAGKWAGVALRAETVSGTDPAAAIARFAARASAQLVVLGTRGLRLGDEAALGSVSAAALESIPSPVLLVPPSVWRAQDASPSDFSQGR